MRLHEISTPKILKKVGDVARDTMTRDVEVPHGMRGYAKAGIGKTALGAFISGLTGHTPDPEDITIFDKRGAKKKTAAPKTAAPQTTPPVQQTKKEPAPAATQTTDTKTVLGSVRDPRTKGTYSLTPSGWVNALGQLVTDPKSLDYLDGLYNMKSRR